MPIANCEKCGAVFLKTLKSICPKCITQEESHFQQAVVWLREHPGETMNSLSKATGIEMRDILRWVREQRLMFSRSAGVPVCRKCGMVIDAGELCETCKSSLSREIGGSPKSAPGERQTEKGSGGMHYVPRRRSKR
jgi:predicted amidophosphoribosyltransferase